MTPQRAMPGAWSCGVVRRGRQKSRRVGRGGQMLLELQPTHGSSDGDAGGMVVRRGSPRAAEVSSRWPGRPNAPRASADPRLVGWRCPGHGRVAMPDAWSCGVVRRGRQKSRHVGRGGQMLLELQPTHGSSDGDAGGMVVRRGSPRAAEVSSRRPGRPKAPRASADPRLVGRRCRGHGRAAWLVGERMLDLREPDGVRAAVSGFLRQNSGFLPAAALGR